MPTIETTIGSALRRVRQELEFTQEAVAERVDISTEFYARMERGHARPSIETFVKLVNVFGISADELLGRARESRTRIVTAGSDASGDPPALRRLLNRVRHASPRARRVISVMLGMLERLEAEASETSRQKREREDDEQEARSE